MPTVFDVRALDSIVRVELDSSIPQTDRERIREQWVDLLEERAEPSARVIGALGTMKRSNDPSVRIVTADSPQRLAAALVTEVTLAGIAALSGLAVMLHAGAFALDDGRVIALVGPSGRGKTTATQVLGRDHAYVTDETVAVRADGSVIPYPKPLAVGGHPEPKLPVPASAAGLRDLPSAPLRLAAIVILDRREHVETPYVEQIPLLESLEALVPQTSALAQLAHPLRTLFTLVLGLGGARRVVYSEAETLSEIVEEMLAPAPLEDPHLLDVGASMSDCGCVRQSAPIDDSSVPTGPTSTYRRTQYSDAVSVDDALVVLSRNRVTVLDGLGPALWFAAEDATEAELTEAALRELPPPPEHIDAQEVVASSVRELVEAGLLARA